jgi:hypothetical protein
MRAKQMYRSQRSRGSTERPQPVAKAVVMIEEGIPYITTRAATIAALYFKKKTIAFKNINVFSKKTGYLPWVGHM